MCCQLHESESERRHLEDVNLQLLLRLENINMSTTTASRAASGNETSLFAELEMLSQSLSVDSFTNQPAQPVTVGTQVTLGLALLTRCHHVQLSALLSSTGGHLDILYTHTPRIILLTMFLVP